MRNTRVVVAAMEPRAGLCKFDGDRWTLTVPGQGVWAQKLQLADILGVTPDKVRILTYNVGGSFGMKGPIYPEYVCLAHAARALGRPVKWTDERSGSFLSDHHGRDHEITGELALDKDGKFLALRMTGFGNVGAYLSNVAPQPPSMNLVRNACGVYRIPLFEVSTKVCFTNTSPVSAYRGAGRPEANMYIERLIDEAAREMKIDRFELRRRNHVTPAEIPYKNRADMTVDSGDFRRGVRKSDQGAGRDSRSGKRNRRREASCAASASAATWKSPRRRTRRWAASSSTATSTSPSSPARSTTARGTPRPWRRCWPRASGFPLKVFPKARRFGQARVRRGHRRLAHGDDERRRGGAGRRPRHQERQDARRREAGSRGSGHRVPRRASSSSPARTGKSRCWISPSARSSMSPT
jgi:CO/xanthine dehydrogenase Mo-binding subunit